MAPVAKVEVAIIEVEVVVVADWWDWAMELGSVAAEGLQIAGFDHVEP